MSGSRVLFVRRAVANVAVQNDEGGPACRLLEDAQCMLDSIGVVCVGDSEHIPAIREETGRDVLREGDARVPLDGDVVVVVNPAEIIQAKVGGERCRFRSNALHQAAVSTDGINVVVEDIEVRPIVAIGKPLLGNGHANAGGYALPERTSRGFDSRDQMVFGMPGRLAVEQAKGADIVERHRRLAQMLVFRVHRLSLRQVEHGPQQHRGVAIRKHKPVAVGPDWVLRIEPHHSVPDCVHQRRERHRRPRMSGLGLLDGVDGKRANCVNAQLIDCGVSDWFSYLCGTHI